MCRHIPLPKLSPPQNTSFKGSLVFNGSVTICNPMKTGVYDGLQLQKPEWRRYDFIWLENKTKKLAQVMWETFPSHFPPCFTQLHMYWVFYMPMSLVVIKCCQKPVLMNGNKVKRLILQWAFFLRRNLKIRRNSCYLTLYDQKTIT